MILIFTEENDISTTHVIEWLTFYKTNYYRVNNNDIIEIIIKNNYFHFIVNDFEIKLNDIKCIWYRRPDLKIKKIIHNVEYFQNLLDVEYSKIVEFFFFKLAKIPSIGNLNPEVNKLIVSDIARDFGFQTPKDYIITNKSELENILKESRLITKIISGLCSYHFKNFTAYNYTTIIDNIDKIPLNFFPSLIQNYIEKKYELRIYYQNGTIYTMAILSQKDTKTEIDFRNYNRDKPNRTLPYKLPLNMEIKIDEFMKKIGLNNGSIDMIVTNRNEYVFLEVNPVGQFGMTSFPTNYNIEKFIAKYLINYERK